MHKTPNSCVKSVQLHGSITDNDDPTVMEPPAGQEWQMDPPHIMVPVALGLGPRNLPDRHRDWRPVDHVRDTPSEHLMFPVVNRSEGN